MADQGRRFAGIGWIWVLGAFAGGCNDGPYLMFEEYYTFTGDERYLGGGCMATGDASASGSSASGVAGAAGESAMQPYTVEYRAREVGITVIVTDGAGKTLAQRDYSEDFLNSGKADDIVVDLESDVLRLHYWGGPECTPPRDPSAD